MELLPALIVAGVTLGLCFLVDKGFTRAFRSKKEHLSGTAVRAGKKYGIFGILFSMIGILAICNWASQGVILLIGGIVALLIGVFLCVYYLSFGIFYDEDSFLLSSLGKKSVSYRYGDIEKQQLYAVSGGSVVIELWLKDGNTVSLQSGMEGVYPFLDTAYIGWCHQRKIDPDRCDFHDPSKSWWFPHDEEER